MIYNLSNKTELTEFDNQIRHFKALSKIVELDQVKPKRSSQQNRALHKFFGMISEELNELGMEFVYTGLKGAEISLRYTPNIVKLFFWKPIQIALFDFESTTKLKSKEMNQIIDIIIKFFGDKGVLIEFPHIENLNE